MYWCEYQCGYDCVCTSDERPACAARFRLASPSRVNSAVLNSAVLNSAVLNSAVLTAA